MTCVSVSRTTRLGALAALAVLIASPALAQRPPLCLPGPRNVPGSGGNEMPAWPDAATPASEWVRTEVSDPRWSRAPLTKMDALQDASFGNPFDGFQRFNDQARFRAVRSADGTELAVSIQLKSLMDQLQSNNASHIWFGLARELNTGTTGDQMPAVAVRIPIGNNDTGNHIAPAGAGIEHLVHPANGAWEQAPNTDWIDSLRVWNDRGQDAVVTNGALWSTQFKINLGDAALEAVDSNLRLVLYISAESGSVEVLGGQEDLGVLQFALPIDAACLSDSVDCDRINLFDTIIANVNPDPKLWHLAFGNPAETCEGISISAMDISSGHFLDGGPVVPSPPLPASETPRGDCDGRPSNCLSAVDTDWNYFKLDTAVPDAWGPLNPNELEVRFRISNWGTVGDGTQWKEVMGGLTNTEGEMGSISIRGNCRNESNEVCTIPLELNPVGGHQCMLAEIQAGTNARDVVTFANASAYVNTRFEQASLVDTVATIDLRNMPDVNPSASEHTVLLNVVQTNMPIAGDVAYEDDVPSMEATRAQVDRSFSDSVNGCGEPSQICLLADGPDYGICATICGGDGWDECPYGTRRSQSDTACFCYPELPGPEDFCTFQFGYPINGGYNPDLRAFDGAQVLQSTYPTYMVYPYLVSGTTVTNDDGEARRQLLPLPSFGIHAYHEGEFYGWLTGMTDMDDNAIEKASDNVYRVTVAKDGLKQIHVLLSAEEKPHFEPMSEIAGSATTLRFRLGNVFLTAISDYASPIDLSQANLSVNELLSESGRELVRNFSGPSALARLPGATRAAAVFAGGASPAVNVEVVDLPLLGQIIQVNALLASVSRPSTCGWFGSANLASELKLGDGINSDVVLRGEDQWSCVPFEMINF